jgi:excisionase family DNA binding protein
VVISENRFLSTEEVAKRLRVDEQTVRRWIKHGKLEAFKIGRAWRISPAALEALLESHSSPKAMTLRERRSGPTAGDSSFEETRTLVRAWEVILEDLLARYQEAFEEIRDAEPEVFPNEVVNVAVLVASHRRLLSREVDEVKEAPGVNAAVEKICNVQASVERIIEQKPFPRDEAHAEQIARFNVARGAAASPSSMEEVEDEPQSGDDRAHNAS